MQDTFFGASSEDARAPAAAVRISVSSPSSSRMASSLPVAWEKISMHPVLGDTPALELSKKPPVATLLT